VKPGPRYLASKLLQIIPCDRFGLSVCRRYISNPGIGLLTQDSVPEQMIDRRYRLAEPPVTNNNSPTMDVELLMQMRLQRPRRVRNDNLSQHNHASAWQSKAPHHTGNQPCDHHNQRKLRHRNPHIPEYHHSMHDSFWLRVAYPVSTILSHHLRQPRLGLYGAPKALQNKHKTMRSVD
jgi:hypothetical protein